jgi:hypothetical protein
MKNTILLITLPLFLFCCHQKNQSIEQTKYCTIVINADSCKKWGLEPVNFEISFPDYYSPELNSSGGFYLQLTKLNNDTLLHQISIGRAANLEIEKLNKYLHDSDSIFKNVFENAGIKYTTDFIGNVNFLGQKVEQSRASVIFNNFMIGESVANGEYSAFTTFRISENNPVEAIVISILSSKEDVLNPENNVAVENERIISTLVLK